MGLGKTPVVYKAFMLDPEDIPILSEIIREHKQRKKGTLTSHEPPFVPTLNPEVYLVEISGNEALPPCNGNTPGYGNGCIVKARFDGGGNISNLGNLTIGNIPIGNTGCLTIDLFNPYRSQAPATDGNIAQRYLAIRDKYGRYWRTLSENDAQIILAVPEQTIPARTGNIAGGSATLGSGNVSILGVHGNGSLYLRHSEVAYNWTRGTVANDGNSILVCERSADQGLLMILGQDCPPA